MVGTKGLSVNLPWAPWARIGNKNRVESNLIWGSSTAAIRVHKESKISLFDPIRHPKLNTLGQIWFFRTLTLITFFIWASDCSGVGQNSFCKTPKIASSTRSSTESSAVLVRKIRTTSLARKNITTCDGLPYVNYIYIFKYILIYYIEITLNFLIFFEEKSKKGILKKECKNWSLWERFLTSMLLHGLIWAKMSFSKFSSSTRWLFLILFEKYQKIQSYFKVP